MKVAIITILDNTNFGTYLQALSLGLSIKGLGHEVEIIRYTRPVMTPKGYSKTLFRERGLLRWLKHRNEIVGIQTLRAKDFQYLQEFLSVTQDYTSFEELFHNPPQAEIYMTGSDQVWNSI